MELAGIMLDHTQMLAGRMPSHSPNPVSGLGEWHRVSHVMTSVVINKYSHALVDLLPTSLVLQSGLCQVNGEDTSDPNNAGNTAINELGWEAGKKL